MQKGSDAALDTPEFQVPHYKESATKLGIVFLRTIFHRDLPEGNSLFETISDAVIDAFADKGAAGGFKQWRNEFTGALNKETKVAKNVADSLDAFSNIIAKFTDALYWQEESQNNLLNEEFNHNEACSLMPHANWHRKSAQMLDTTVDVIANDLPGMLQNGWGYWDKFMKVFEISLDLDRIQSSANKLLQMVQLTSRDDVFKRGLNSQLRSAINTKADAAGLYQHTFEFCR